LGLAAAVVLLVALLTILTTAAAQKTAGEPVAATAGRESCFGGACYETTGRGAVSQTLRVTLTAPGWAAEYLTIANSGSYSLYFEIVERPADAPRAAEGGSARRLPETAFRWLAGEVQIDPQVYAQGTTDFFVQLRSQADLSGAEEIADWNARGAFVYNALREAAKAQAPIIAYAEAQGLAYETRLSNNAVFIKGGSLADVDALAVRADVYQIRANHVYELEESHLAAEIEAWGWNLDELDPNSNLWGMEAAQVWDQLGVFGEGVVVANIDTGVFYQHEALDRQYRGNLSGAIGGPYDHDFHWYGPAGGCPTPGEPCDDNGHGSGTIGIVVGETEDLAEQIGVAPGARWIACKACTSSGCTEAALTACGDWLLAPCPIGADPGDPSCNPDKRPHVVNNSWGSAGCDPWYQSYVQAWNAAGIFSAFSLGGTLACSALGSPGDYAEAFSPAAHGTDGQNLYSGGPSCFFPAPGCDPGDHQVDPHLSAPTFVRTADNAPGAYYTLGGSSATAPHVAGCMALIWSANPALRGNISNTYTILEQSADRTSTQPWSEGVCGKPACAGAAPYPNYEYGWGYLDCLAAVAGSRPADISWVSAEPVTGTVPPGGQQVVKVAFTCTLTDALEPQPLEGRLRVQHDDPCQEPVDYALALYCRQPSLTLAKNGPVVAPAGGTIPLTLSIASEGDFVGDVVLTDTLPAGMRYAGSLTWTYGTAWEDGGTVYWTNVPTEGLPSQMAIRFEVMVEGDGGEVIRNVAVLDWGTDSTEDAHEVTIEGALPVFYLPLVYKGW
jgi:subtilisin family serine protease